ncbi:hypothetical protein Clacol_008890 [Clathrus columnatus]|uniref:CFEM domain-containing protein n=1 Tax=Clathrus columnatus TaxID=1419009 RepID=A0AAV5AJ10_9AGAM|nr:hypothetical protein Clacol_008890 [Clathrus columnatus]
MQIISASVFALFFAAATSAFTLSIRQQGAPDCALTCLTTTPTGSCSPTNDTCLCNDDTFLEAQFNCVKKACTSSSDFQAAQTFALTLCQQVGVDLTTDTFLIPAATGSNTTAPSSTAPASAGSPTTTTSGAISLNFHAAGALLLTVAGIALTL